MSNTFEQQYLDMLRYIRDKGHVKTDRTGTGTKSVFGYQMRFDISGGKLPVLTTKKLFLRGIIEELLWFLKGDTNIQYLVERNVHIWDEWAKEDGSLGPVYGKQWRDWVGHRLVHKTNLTPDMHDSLTKRGFSCIGEFPYHDSSIVIYRRSIDQITNVINRLKTQPDCRRIIVNAWNVDDLDEMALTPCHAMFQFWTRELSIQERFDYVKNNSTPLVIHDSEKEMIALAMDEAGVPKYALSSQLYQRSSDVFLGVPFNIVSYSLLTQMIAQVTNMVAEDFVWVSGDTHIYANHEEQINEQLSREPIQIQPIMKLTPNVNDIFRFTIDDFQLTNYESHPAIKAPVAV